MHGSYRSVRMADSVEEPVLHKDLFQVVRVHRLWDHEYFVLIESLCELAIVRRLAILHGLLGIAEGVFVGARVQHALAQGEVGKCVARIERYGYDGLAKDIRVAELPVAPLPVLFPRDGIPTPYIRLRLPGSMYRRSSTPLSSPS